MTSNGVAGATVSYPIKGDVGPSLGCAVNTTARYFDFGETVFDTQTGLLWEKRTGTPGLETTCPIGNPHDVNSFCGFTNDGISPNGIAFTSFLASLNTPAGPTCTSGDGVTVSCAGVDAHGCFTGHCDWRLPEINELVGIGDAAAPGCDSGTACIDPIFGPSTVGPYLTADTFPNSPGIEWLVEFAGAPAPLFDLPAGYVRAVRGAR